MAKKHLYDISGNYSLFEIGSDEYEKALKNGHYETPREAKEAYDLGQKQEAVKQEEEEKVAQEEENKNVGLSLIKNLSDENLKVLYQECDDELVSRGLLDPPKDEKKEVDTTEDALEYYKKIARAKGILFPHNIGLQALKNKIEEAK